MASIYFLHFHQIEYHCRTNEPCAQAIDWKDEQKHMLPEHSLLYLFFDMGTPEFSSLAPSHHSDLRANVPSSEGSLLTSIKPLPSPMTRYACYAFMASAALFPSEIILLSGCLYVMSIFPSLTSMWACRERESCQSQSPLCLHHKEPA